MQQRNGTKQSKASLTKACFLDIIYIPTQEEIINFLVLETLID